jgi:AraC-like DNA-binding protein
MSRKRRTVDDEPFLIVRTAASDHRAASVIDTHTHEWHQLAYVSRGLMTVGTESGSWIAPPNWAIWIPAGVRHAIRFVSDSSLRTAYLRPASRTDFPAACTVITITPLMRELILATDAHGMLDRRDEFDAALATLLAAGLRTTDVPAFSLPYPVSVAMAEAARLIARDAPEAGSLVSLSKAVGMGTRTFERRFLGETGMTPGRWRQQHALQRGLEQLALGASIKTVAAAAGYATPSAFIAAFRKSFGTTPGRYFPIKGTEILIGSRGQRS